MRNKRRGVELGIGCCVAWMASPVFAQSSSAPMTPQDPAAAPAPAAPPPAASAPPAAGSPSPAPAAAEPSAAPSAVAPAPGANAATGVGPTPSAAADPVAATTAVEPTAEASPGTLVLATDTATASPPPGRGEGFFLNAGLGHSLTRWLIDQASDDGDLRYAQTELGVAGQVQLGYLLPIGLALHVTERQSWFTSSRVGDRSVQLASFTGLGATYFFRPQAPSAYVTGSLGLSNWGTFDDGFNLGFGACAGAGYEFSEHWSVEQSYCFGTAKQRFEQRGQTVAVEGKPFAAALTINYLLY